MKIKWFKRLCFFLFSFVILWTAGIGTLSFLYTWRLLHPICQPTRANVEIQTPVGSKVLQPVTFQTTDGLSLDGWWLPPENGVVILLLGGLGANKDNMLPEAKILARQGYGVLTSSYRHCAGEIATLGENELYELQAMLDFASAQEKVEHLGVLGFSVGGTVAIRGAARHPELEAVIAEGNFANLKEEITASPASIFSIQWQVQHLVIFFFRLLTGVRAGSISPLDDIPQIAPRPIFFIHGEREAQRTQAEDQYQAGLPNAELWVVPSSGHGEYRLYASQEYEDRILQFFNNVFLQNQN